MTATGQLLGEQLQPREICELSYQAGWVDLTELATAVAVCLAESDGFTEAIDRDSDGSVDRGIYQLNSIHAEITDAIAYNPAEAAKAAHGLYVAAGKAFTPWAAFNSGICFDDSYALRALLGVMNFAAAGLAAEQASRPDRAAHHSLTVPVVSIKQLKALWPAVAL